MYFKNIPFLEKSSGTKYKSYVFQLDEKVNEIRFKTVLSDLDWKSFFIAQIWWAVFKISFVRLY